MIVQMIADKKKVTVNDSYGARLIEQGKAVFVPVDKKELVEDSSASAATTVCDERPLQEQPDDAAKAQKGTKKR